MTFCNCAPDTSVKIHKRVSEIHTRHPGEDLIKAVSDTRGNCEIVICKVSRLSRTMTFTISMMTQICLLVAVFMLAPVIGRDVDKRQEGSTPPATLCGRRPAVSRKRSDEHTGSSDEDSSDNLDKILRGINATHGDVPWIVNIFADGNPRCAGAIISKFWILTAADCVDPWSTSNYSMVVGDTTFSRDDEGQQTLGYSKIIKRRLHNESIHNNPVLIKVSGSGIQFNDYVQPVCLPVEGENREPGRWLRMAGWGYHPEDHSTHPGELKTLLVRVMNQTHCASFFPPGWITSDELCVRQKNRTGDACPGDNGGPVTFQSGEVHILAGIITRSISLCQVPSDGVVLANVLSHKTWIEEVINRSNNANERVIPSRTA